LARRAPKTLYANNVNQPTYLFEHVATEKRGRVRVRREFGGRGCHIGDSRTSAEYQSGGRQGHLLAFFASAAKSATQFCKTKRRVRCVSKSKGCVRTQCVGRSVRLYSQKKQASGQWCASCGAWSLFEISFTCGYLLLLFHSRLPATPSAANLTPAPPHLSAPPTLLEKHLTSCPNIRRALKKAAIFSAHILLYNRNSGVTST